MLVGNRDVDLYQILMPLGDKDLLNFCKSAVKEEYEKSLCNDETFWKLRTQKYYPLSYEKSKNELTWKDYYLRTVYYKDKLKNEFNYDLTPEDSDAKVLYKLFEYQQKQITSNFIGNRDVDFSILLQLDDVTFFSLCGKRQFSKYLRNICNNENLWRQRLFKYHGQLFPEPGQSWKDLYLSKAEKNDLRIYLMK